MEDLQKEIDELKEQLTEKDKEIDVLQDEIKDTKNSLEQIIYDLNRLT